MKVLVETVLGQNMQLEFPESASVNELQAHLSQVSSMPPVDLFPLYTCAGALENAKGAPTQLVGNLILQHGSMLYQGLPRRDFQMPCVDVSYEANVVGALEWTRKQRSIANEDYHAVLQSRLEGLLSDAILEPDVLLLLHHQNAPRKATLSQEPFNTSSPPLSPRTAVSSGHSPSFQRRGQQPWARGTCSATSLSTIKQVTLLPAETPQIFEIFAHTKLLSRTCPDFRWRYLVQLSAKRRGLVLQCAASAEVRIAGLRARCKAFEIDAVDGKDMIAWDEVAAAQRLLLEQSPLNVDAWYNLGVSLQEQRPQLEALLREAVWAFRRCLALQPHDPDAMSALTSLEEHFDGDLETVELRAVDQCRMMLEVSPDSPDALFDLGAALLWKDHSVKDDVLEGLDMLRQCLGLQPNRMGARFLLGAMQHSLDESETGHVGTEARALGVHQLRRHVQLGARRKRQMRSAWLHTPQAAKGDELWASPVVILADSEDGVPPLQARHVCEALHVTYTVGESIRQTGDDLVSLVRCIFSWGVTSEELLTRLQNALHASPSVATVKLARWYGYCQQPKEHYYRDFEKFLLHTLSTFQGAELFKFRGFAAPRDEVQQHKSEPHSSVSDLQWFGEAAAGANEQLALEILERRIYLLEHLFQSPSSMSKAHFRQGSSQTGKPRSQPTPRGRNKR